MYKVILEGGKYTVQHNHGTEFRASRYGLHWRDLTGDGLVLALVQHIESLEEKLQESDNRASQFADDINRHSIRFGETEQALIDALKLIWSTPVNDKYLEASCTYDTHYENYRNLFDNSKKALGDRFVEVYRK
jgi:hypothetical protein